MTKFIEEYDKYFTSRQFTRLDLFKLLKKKYGVESALYLGSHIHITPSLVYPEVVYVDSYKKFKDMVDSEEAFNFIIKNKLYSKTPTFEFIQQNYDKPLSLHSSYDLLISQYAGFVSQAGKNYLKHGGILIANNSHGDATMAYLDDDFELIAAANQTKDKWRLTTSNLDGYFVRKDGSSDNVKELSSTMKGPAYIKSAANYIFKKL